MILKQKDLHTELHRVSHIEKKIGPIYGHLKTGLSHKSKKETCNFANVNRNRQITSKSMSYCNQSVADPGFGQGGGQEFFSENLPT